MSDDEVRGIAIGIGLIVIVIIMIAGAMDIERRDTCRDLILLFGAAKQIEAVSLLRATGPCHGIDVRQ